MLILLAAVEEETQLLRQQLDALEPRQLDGCAVWDGHYGDTPVRLAHSGIGKAAVAASTIATLLQTQQADALWLFGCGGAYLGSGLDIGDLALANKEIFGDEGVETPRGFRSLTEMKLPMRQDASQSYYNDWPLDPTLQRWALAQLEHWPQRPCQLRSGPFVTLSTCTGRSDRAAEIEARTGGICENMEGAAAALACAQHQVPMLELRGISNLVEDRDPSRWNLKAGMDAAQLGVLHLLQQWREYTP
ncbi:MAG: futalosine hydrolase [Desulfuromonadales bacterium]|nr:futalosine hydrolase [Desulfuromonadales bacterium]